MPTVVRGPGGEGFTVRSVVSPGLRFTIGTYATLDEALEADERFQKTGETQHNRPLWFKNVWEEKNGKWKYEYKGKMVGGFQTCIAAAHARRRVKDNDAQRLARSKGRGKTAAKKTRRNKQPAQQHCNKNTETAGPQPPCQAQPVCLEPLPCPVAPIWCEIKPDSLYDDAVLLDYTGRWGLSPNGLGGDFHF